jgi:hypothetical protein
MSNHTSSVARPLGLGLGLGALGLVASALACSSGSADPNAAQTGNSGGTTSNAGSNGNDDGGSSNSNNGGATNGSGGNNSSNGGTNNGNGGSQSEGGESGNEGGTGGSAPDEPSVCDGATDVRLTNNGYVDNLEDPETDTDAFWDSYVDDMGGMAENRAFVSPGALGTATAIHYAGSTGTTPGMAYAGLTRSLGCTDVSAFDGISFWAMGTDGLEIFMQVGTPDTQKEGGDCLEMCYDHPEKSIVLSDQWSQYAVTWDELAQQGFGNPAEFEGMTVLLNWRTAIGDFDFSIDEISFFSGDAPTDPVMPPGGMDPGGSPDAGP